MQLRTPITLAVLVMILLGAAYYGWHTVVDPVTDSGSSSATPTTQPPHTHPPKLVCLKHKTYPVGTEIRAASFLVNVYNAGSVSGKAGDVLADLQSRGFRLGVAANPPAAIRATNVTILTSTPTSPRVQLVRDQFKGDVRLVPGPQLAVGIDIVIGPHFVGLVPNAPTTFTVKQPTTICTESATKPASTR